MNIGQTHTILCHLQKTALGFFVLFCCPCSIHPTSTGAQTSQHNRLSQPHPGPRPSSRATVQGMRSGCQTDQTSTERRGGGYHLIRLRGVDPVQDALNSVQLGMQGFDALLCPLFGLERPQCLGWHGDTGRVTPGRTKGQRKTATPRCYGHPKPPSVVPGPPADCCP